MHLASLRFAELEVRRTRASAARALQHQTQVQPLQIPELNKFAHGAVVQTLRSHGLAIGKRNFELREIQRAGA